MKFDNSKSYTSCSVAEGKNTPTKSNLEGEGQSGYFSSWLQDNGPSS